MSMRKYLSKQKGYWEEDQNYHEKFSGCNPRKEQREGDQLDVQIKSREGIFMINMNI